VSDSATAHAPDRAPARVSALLASLRLLSAVLHGLRGLFTILWHFPKLGLAERQARIAAWSLGMLRALGVQHEAGGSFRTGGTLIVANHVSWLDIMAIHAVCPRARFVSKADVQHWPLINRLVDGADTLYIERASRRDAMRVVHQIAEALQAGQAVAVFPEGTTGPGHPLLPFHANLLQAGIAAGVPVQPVALRYRDASAPYSASASFVGDTTLLQSLWMIARGRGLTVSVQALPPLATLHTERRALAVLAREQIVQALPDPMRPEH
jgi:1-acyl-sn-glycerol-3-phosphate acyltransferase